VNPKRASILGGMPIPVALGYPRRGWKKKLTTNGGRKKKERKRLVLKQERR